MSNGTPFLILPYLRTSEPVDICGFNLRSTNDLGNLSEEAAKTLQEIRELFFLDNHQQINEMVYTTFDTSSSESQARAERMRLLLTFLYGSPSSAGRPFLSSDHATTFLVWASPVSEFLVSSDLTTNHWPKAAVPTFDDFHMSSGFHLFRNGRELHQTLQGGRVYPAAPGIWLNYSQDLYLDSISFLQHEHNWPINRFLGPESELEKNFERRILNSLRWYGRSLSVASDADDSLLHLAIALESLLNLDEGGGISDRFVETVTILLGSTDRLAIWARQFYNARSKIVHLGAWPNLNFYPNSSPPGKKGGEPVGKPHRSLHEFGQRVFRMCLTTILSGAFIARRSKLQSAFISNEERMIVIRKAIEDGTLGATARLRLIAKEVLELNDYHDFGGELVNLDSLVSLAVSMIKLSLESGLLPTPELEAEATAVANSDGDIYQKHHLIEQAKEATVRWRSQTYDFTASSEIGQLGLMEKEPALILATFLDYACNPSIRFQLLSQAQVKAPTTEAETADLPA